MSLLPPTSSSAPFNLTYFKLLLVGIYPNISNKKRQKVWNLLWLNNFFAARSKGIMQHEIVPLKYFLYFKLKKLVENVLILCISLYFHF